MSNVVSLRSNVSGADNEVVRFLEQHPLLNRLDADQLFELAAQTRTRRFSRRSTIWSVGDPASMVYLIRRGVVRISRHTPNDRELSLHVLGRKAFAGHEALFGSDPERETKAIAHEDALLYAIPRDVFLNTMRQAPQLGVDLFADLNAYRQRLDQRIAAIAYLTARARVASVLLELAEDFGVQDSRGTIVNVRLTHREMASLIGATRETVSFAILAFRRSGLIQTEQKRVVLLDIPALQAAANEDDDGGSR